MIRKSPGIHSEPTDVEGRIQEEAQEDLACLSKGLAHPTRVKIISMLARKSGERRIICADIVSAFPLAQSTISQHLKVLKETGWVETTVEYPRIFYSLTDGVIDHFKQLLHSCRKQPATKKNH